MRPHQYQAYVENSVIGGNPVTLVVALYEAAIDATRQAQRCLESRDIWGRSKAISKGMNAVTELIVSLDCEKGGEIGNRLKRLYAYMQTRLLEAHAKQTTEPLKEVEKLLGTLLTAWRVVEIKTAAAEHNEPARSATAAVPGEEDQVVFSYGGYLGEPMETLSRLAYTF